MNAIVFRSFKITEENLDTVFIPSPGWIRFVHVQSSESRKLVHQYIEGHNTSSDKSQQVFTTSGYCNTFEADIRSRYGRCYEDDCWSRNAKITTVFYEPLSNPYFEGWVEQRTCEKCGNVGLSDDLRSGDDDDRVVHHNNLILSGTFFKAYNRPKGYIMTQKDVSKLDLLEVLEDMTMYEILEPPFVNGRPMKKELLLEYITQTVKTSG